MHHVEKETLMTGIVIVGEIAGTWVIGIGSEAGDMIEIGTLVAQIEIVTETETGIGISGEVLRSLAGHGAGK